MSAGLSPKGGGVRTFHLAKVRGGSQFDFINLAFFQFGDISFFLQNLGYDDMVDISLCHNISIDKVAHGEEPIKEVLQMQVLLKPPTITPIHSGESKSNFPQGPKIIIGKVIPSQAEPYCITMPARHNGMARA